MQHSSPAQAPREPSARRPLIFRQVTFSLAAFDKLKHCQRTLAAHGLQLSNSEVLDRLILAAPML
jgi:hypothetical protein